MSLRILTIDYGYVPGPQTPDDLLRAMPVLVEWSEAVRGAGAAAVHVVQRFQADAELRLGEVGYVFRGKPLHSALHEWSSTGALNAAAAALEPDVVHVNGLQFPLHTWLLRRALPRGTAIVVQDHANALPTTPSSLVDRVRHVTKRRAMSVADAFFFTASAQAEGWQRSGLIAPDQRVYPILEASTTMRPIDRDAARARTGMHGRPAVLWVGRLDQNKDPLMVLEGFARARADIGSAAVLTLVFAASGLLGQVEDKIRSLGLTGAVALVGPVPHENLTAYYSGADFFVLGSHHEGSGFALIEACACGAVPVVTDIPSFRVITGHGAGKRGAGVGALWMPGQASDLAHALVASSRFDPAVERARTIEHFRQTLSWPVIGQRALEAYRDALEHHNIREASSP